MKQNRRCLKIVVTGIVALTPVAVLALEPAMNARGTITRIDSNTLEIKERDGTSEKVRLAENAKIAAVAKANLSDIQPGSFIGTAGTPRTDGTLQAIEVHIFPESMRWTGEGNRAGTLAQKAA
jgi:hypothetical protein